MRLPGGGNQIVIQVLERKREPKKVEEWMISGGEKNPDNNNRIARVIGNQIVILFF